MQNGALVTKEDEGEREGWTAQGPPVDKHGACLYPWIQALSAMSLRGVGRGGGGLH